MICWSCEPGRSSKFAERCDRAGRFSVIVLKQSAVTRRIIGLRTMATFKKVFVGLWGQLRQALEDHLSGHRLDAGGPKISALNVTSNPYKDL